MKEKLANVKDDVWYYVAYHDQKYLTKLNKDWNVKTTWETEMDMVDELMEKGDGKIDMQQLIKVDEKVHKMAKDNAKKGKAVTTGL